MQHVIIDPTKESYHYLEDTKEGTKLLQEDLEEINIEYSTFENGIVYQNGVDCTIAKMDWITKEVIKIDVPRQVLINFINQFK